MKDIFIALIIYDCFKFICSIIVARIARKKNPEQYDAIVKQKKENEFTFDANVREFVKN